MPNSILKKQSLLVILFWLLSAHIALAELDGFKTVHPFDSRDARLPEQGLKLVWWNIGCGLETGGERIAGSLRSTRLEENLIQLVSTEYQPDVLILGEFCPQNMPSEDLSFLKGKFNHNFHLHRNIPRNASFTRGASSGNGFLILSKYKISIARNETLFANTKSENHNDNRRYLVFNLVKNQISYSINPVHLVNPWRKIYNESGSLGVFNELTSGQVNSNAIQIKNLIELNEKHIHRADRHLTIGDFNSPGSIYGFSGYGYKLMKSAMSDLMYGHEITFLGEGPYPSSNIDHAFGNNLRTMYAKVWPLEGSKHLPIYIVIE